MICVVSFGLFSIEFSSIYYILIVAIIVGTIIGLIFQEKATVLSPLGDIFLNLLLVIIVPLIFLNNIYMMFYLVWFLLN